ESTLDDVFCFCHQSTVNKRCRMLDANIGKNQNITAQRTAKTQCFMRLHESLFGYDGAAVNVDANKRCPNGRRYRQSGFTVIPQDIQSDWTRNASFQLARDS